MKKKTFNQYRLSLLIYSLMSFLYLESACANYFFPYYQPTFSDMQSGEGLVKGIHPKHSDVLRLFDKFMDVSALKYTEEPPVTRASKNFHFDDAAQMKGLKILINRGSIKKGTLILSDTGHDIPTAAFFMREYSHLFNIQSVFYYPPQLYKDSGNYDRLISQAQDWAQDLALWQEQHALQGMPDIIFLGLEAHRKDYTKKYLYEIPWRLLPTKEDLNEIGIDKVIFLTEAHPDAELEVIKGKMRRDVKIYLDSLKMPTTYLGNDCRREAGCSEYKF